MSYKIGENVNYKQFFKDIRQFLTTMTTVKEPDYSLSTGNGTVSGVKALTDLTHLIELKCIDATNKTFSVTSNVNGQLGTATVGILYEDTYISFTLQEGSTPWSLNDIITIEIVNSTNPAWKPLIYNESNETDVNIFVGHTCKSGFMGGTVYSTQTLFAVQGPKPDSIGARTLGAVPGPYIFPNITVSTPSSSVAQFTLAFWIKNPNTQRDIYYSKHGGDIIQGYGSGAGIAKSLSILFSQNSIYAYIPASTDDNTYEYYRYSWDNITTPNFSEWCFVTFSVNKNDEWARVTLTINGVTYKSNRDIQVEEYLNGTLTTPPAAIPEYYNLVPFFYKVRVFADLTTLVYFNYLLSSAEITDIIQNNTMIDYRAPEIVDAITFEEEDTMPLVGLYNISDTGVPISAYLTPYKNPYYSYEVSTYQAARIFNLRDLVYMNKLTINTDNTYYITQYELDNITTNNVIHNRVFTLGGRPTNVNISKYWISADNNCIRIVYKIYDPTSVQQLPVYQHIYIGLAETLNEEIRKVAIGSLRTGNDYWYTNDSGFFSGYYNPYNSSWDTPLGFTNSKIVTSPNYSNSYIYNSTTQLNIWKPSHIYDWSETVTKYYTYGARLNFQKALGSFRGVFSVQPNGLKPEDIVTINNKNYVACTDCTQSEGNSLLLIELGE